MKRKFLIDENIKNKNSNTEIENKEVKKVINPFKKTTTTSQEKVVEEEVENILDRSIDSYNDIMSKVNKVFRPLIEKYSISSNNMESSQYFIHNKNEPLGNNLLFYNSIISDNKVTSSMRYVIPSLNCVTNEYKELNKSKIIKSIYVRPLNTPQNSNEEIILIDKTDSNTILRCESCKAFANPGFTFQKNYSVYECNLCYFKGKNIAGLNEDSVELQYGSFDMLLDKSKFTINKSSSNNITIVIENSSKSIESGIFGRIILSLSNIIQSLPESLNIVITTLDTHVKFFRIVNDSIEEWISLDEKDPCCPYSIDELKLNVNTDKDKIITLLNYIQDSCFKNYETNYESMRKLPINYKTALNILKDLYSNEGGRVLLMHTNITNIINIEYNNNKVSEDKPIFDFVNNSQNQNIKEFIEISEELKKNNIIVDALYFQFMNNLNIIPISQIVKRTSGQINIIRDYKDDLNGEKLYYILFKYLNKNVGSDVAFRMRTSNCVDILNYYTPSGIKTELDFTLPGLSEDQYILCNFQLNDKINKNNLYFQFITLFTDIWDQRIMRIHNIRLPVLNSFVEIYKNLNSEVSTIYFLRDNLYNINKASLKSNETSMYNYIKDFFGYYRFESNNHFEDKDFALPSSLKHFPLYIYNLFCLPFFNSSIVNINLNHIFEDIINYENMDLYSLLLALYPKIYKINYNKYVENNIGDNDINHFIILPYSIPNDKKVFQDNKIYIIDNAEEIIIYIKSIADTEEINLLFGINDFNELYQIKELPELENELNIKIHNIINFLRTKKGSIYQNLVIIPEGSELENKYLKNIYSETLTCKYGDSYWKFLNQLHVDIKLLRN